MSIKRIPLDSPYYPLPADYPTLTQEGQRLARINAAKQYLLPNTPEVKRDVYIHSLNFFDQYYLWPDEDFQPGFYDVDPVATPSMHWQMARAWMGRRSIAIMPRGSGKSFTVRKSIILEGVTFERNSIVYTSSSHDNAVTTGEELKLQFANNERLIDDWAPEMGGRLLPIKGQGRLSNQAFRLMNGSKFETRSIASKQRGLRPRIYILDDPEWDESGSTSMAMMREGLEKRVFKLIMPMMARPGTSFRWTATFVSKRHYAWVAMQLDENTGRAIDDRFDHWHRLHIEAAYNDEKTGELISCWPAMWPSASEKAANPALAENVSIEELKLSVGPAVWNAEYMGRPGDTDEQYFGGLNKHKHGWWIEDLDHLWATEPTKSNATICWMEGTEDNPIEKRVPVKEFVRQARLFITGDTSYTATKTSDFKALAVQALYPGNILFILDLWHKQVHESKLVQAAFQLADKWKVPSIHPEVVKGGLTFYQQLESIVNTRAADEFGVSHLPRIMPIKPGTIEKTAKIAALGPRFYHGKIKLPLHERMRTPWVHLFDQIESFNPDAEDGGLQHDDAIDVVSMSMYVIRGRLNQILEDNPEEPRPVLDRMKAGEIYDEMGAVLGTGLDLQNVSVKDVREIMAARTQPARNNDGSFA